MGPAKSSDRVSAKRPCQLSVMRCHRACAYSSCLRRSKVRHSATLSELQEKRKRNAPLSRVVRSHTRLMTVLSWISFSFSCSVLDIWLRMPSREFRLLPRGYVRAWRGADSAKVLTRSALIWRILKSFEHGQREAEGEIEGRSLLFVATMLKAMRKRSCSPSTIV